MLTKRPEPRASLRAVSLAVWVAYLVVPVEGWGLFHGRPLGLLSTTALAVVCWVAFERRSAAPWRVVAIALALKVGIGTTAIVPRGFAARYYANANFAGPVERGTEPSDASFTRTDHRLRFGIDDEPDVLLAFFNDEVRFNFYNEKDPDRGTLPFSATWQGFWEVRSDTPQALYVVSPAGAAQITVGDTFSARVEPGARWTGVVALPPGYHRVAIIWSVPQGGARQFDAGRIVEGHDEPFDDTTIVRRRAGAVSLAIDRMVRATSQALDACLIAWLLAQLAGGIAGAYRRLHAAFDPHAALVLAWALGIGDALVAAVPALGRMITMSGGNDWLTYETHARDIALNGLWMNGGAALGHGVPFFQQPLYPYFLAACHWLFGDGFSGILFVQRLFAAATIILLWRTVALLFDEPAGLAALVPAIVIVYEKFAPWSGIMLTETLFVPLVCFWMYTVVRFAEAPSPRRAIGAGVVGGLATLARSSLLVGWAGVIPALALSMGWRRQRLGLLAMLVTTMIAVTSMATIRNWVVAHKLVAVSSEGAVVLFVGNSPPPLAIPSAHKTQYERLGLEPFVQAVVEYARQQPGTFGRGLWRKAQYTLGWFDAVRPGAGTSTFYIVTWVMALLGVALLPWMTPRQSLALVLIPLLVAASHFGVVVLFQPHVYGDRLLMPLYMLLVPYAAMPVIAAARWADRFGRETSAALCWTVLFLALCGHLTGRLADVDMDLVTVALLVGGLCLAGLPRLRPVAAATYLAYAVVLAIWLVREPNAPRGAICRAEWLFLAVALFSGTLLPDRVARLIPPASRVRRALTYVASAALTIAALRALGTSVNPERALMAGRIAAFGLAGAAIYALVWIEGAWPAGDTVVSLAAQGVVFGFLVEIMFGAELASHGAAALLIAGLAIGASSRHSMRGAGTLLPP
jgi:hypothetical protein